MTAYLNTDDLRKRADEIDFVLGEEEISPEERADLVEERAELQEIEDYCEDWLYGATIIPDSEFKDYAMQLAEDIGAVTTELRWPLNHIDWDAAAEALKEDYTEVTYRGVSYHVQ